MGRKQMLETCQEGQRIFSSTIFLSLFIVEISLCASFCWRTFSLWPSRDVKTWQPLESGNVSRSEAAIAKTENYYFVHSLSLSVTLTLHQFRAQTRVCRLLSIGFFVRQKCSNARNIRAAASAWGLSRGKILSGIYSAAWSLHESPKFCKTEKKFPFLD